MNSLFNIACAIILSFFNFYPKECEEAISFIQSNRPEIASTMSHLSKDEQLMAISIVAPEITQFSTVYDFLELRTLYILYRNTGKSNFSVGYFQMKPSFIEDMESYIRKNNILKKRYNSLLPSGKEKEKREFRLNNLSSLKGQLRYLELFIDIAKLKTESIKFPDTKSRLKYWATLYNSGLNINYDTNIKFQKKKFFPRDSKLFNFSDVSVEFYDKLKDNW